jgi:hypothetical protein
MRNDFFITNSYPFTYVRAYICFHEKIIVVCHFASFFLRVIIIFAPIFKINRSPPPHHKMTGLPPRGGENACGVLTESFTLKGRVLNP